MHPWIWPYYVRENTWRPDRSPRMCCGHHHSGRSHSRHRSRIISRMNGGLARLSRSLLLPIVFGLAANEATALPLGGDTHFQRALAVIENDHAGLCPATASQEEFEATIARLADENRAEPASVPSGPASLGALNRMVFGRLGIRATADLKDPCNLLPSRVLERKQGYCVGIAALYLVLADRLQLPVYGHTLARLPALRRRHHAHQYRDAARRCQRPGRAVHPGAEDPGEINPPRRFHARPDGGGI